MAVDARSAICSRSSCASAENRVKMNRPIGKRALPFYFPVDSFPRTALDGRRAVECFLRVVSPLVIFAGMADATQLLVAAAAGDAKAAAELLPLVYDELRKLAAARMAEEKSGQTLQATALVHEAYVRLVDVGKAQRWDHRGHFFAAAAE